MPTLSKYKLNVAFKTKRFHYIIRETSGQTTAHQAYYYLELNHHDHIIHTFGYIENDLNLFISIHEYAQYGDLCCQSILVFEADTIESKNTLVKITDFTFTRSNDYRSPDQKLQMIQLR